MFQRANRGTHEPRGWAIFWGLLALVAIVAASVCLGIVAPTAGASSPMLAWTSRGAITPNDRNQAHTVTSPLTGVACTTSGHCRAVGNYRAHSHGGVVQRALVEPLDVGFTQGRHASTPPLPPGAKFRRSSNLATISCAGKSFCVALSSGGGLIETLRDGSWKPTAGLPMPRGESPSKAGAAINSVSCASSGFCVAVGRYTNHRGRRAPLIETLKSASWHAAAGPTPADGRSPKSQTASLSGVSCPATNFCVAVGRYTDKKGKSRGLIETFKKGKWVPAGTSRSIGRLTAVSCPVRYVCTAVGEDSSGSRPIVDRLAVTLWVTGALPADPHSTSGSSTLSAISCSTTWSCIAGGEYRKRSNHQRRGFVR